MARILIVEDELIVAEDLSNVLTDLGYEVVGKVSDADNAVSKALELKPDIILMDIMLRGAKNGIEAAYEIRKQFDIPIVYLTAYTDPPIINDAVHTAPYAYLVKPFQTRQLMATIEMTLYRSKIDIQLHETQKWLITTLKSISDAAIVIDTKGKIMYMNRHAEKMTGWNYNSTTDGTPIWQVFDITDQPTQERLDVMKRVFDDESQIPPSDDDNTHQTILTTRTGETIAIHDRYTRVKNDGGELLGAVMLFRRDHNI